LAGHLPELLGGREQRRLDPGELLAVDDHVAGCSACRELLRAATPGREALFSLKKSLETLNTVDEHLADASLRAYVADRLDQIDRELTEAHLQDCTFCRTKVARILAQNE
jgi:anti-sigma factor RsiW